MEKSTIASVKQEPIAVKTETSNISNDNGKSENKNKKKNNSSSKIMNSNNENSNSNNSNKNSNSNNGSGGDESMMDSGQWLMVTTSMGICLGYVRLDDREHDLTLHDIRNLISPQLEGNDEFGHGWSFATDWPLKTLNNDLEKRNFAKDYLPSISIVADTFATQINANIISNGVNAIFQIHLFTLFHACHVCHAYCN